MTDDQTEPPAEGFSRRRMILTSGAIGGAAWVAPTLLSVPAAAAQSSPAPPAPSNPRYHGDSKSQIDTISIDESNLTDTSWVLIGGAAFRGEAVASLSPTTPDWTVVGNGVVPAGDGEMAIFAKVIDGTNPAQQNQFLTIDFDAPVAATIFVLSYPTGVGWEPAGPQAFEAGTGVDPSAAAITTLGDNRTVVYVSAWGDQNGSPMASGFTARGTTTSQLISLTVGDLVEPSPATVGPTTASSALPNPVVWMAGLIAVYA